MTSETKDTNPKDAVGVRKAPFSTVPAHVTAEVGLAMLEGARKYGRHNYRVAGVRASVYYDATMRHLADWWEGQDIDPDSGLSHIIKAVACLYVLRDAQVNGMCADDRPPSLSDPDWVRRLNDQAGAIIDKYPDPKAPFVRAQPSIQSSTAVPATAGSHACEGFKKPALLFCYECGLPDTEHAFGCSQAST